MITTSALGWALVHFLWQGALIAGLARLTLAALDRRSAAVRYSVALLALAAMPLAVGVTVGRGLGTDRPATLDGSAVSRGHSTDPAPDVPVVASTAPASLPGDGTVPRTETPAMSLRARITAAAPWLVGVWAAGALLLSLRLLLGFAGARRLRQHGTSPAPDDVLSVTARLIERLRITRAVRVCTSALARVPSVVGWLSPVILLPASALTGLSPAQLEAIIAHELAHVRRHDYLVNLVQSVIETLLFYHPAVWWLGATIREEREHCCDDVAVAVSGSAPRYAEALLVMEQLRGTPALAMSATGGSLLSRVERLLAVRREAPSEFPRWLAGAVVATVVLSVGGAPLVTASSQEPQAEAQGRGADTVLMHPDPSQPLDRRTAWALADAGQRRFGAYWVGHTVDPHLYYADGFFMGRIRGGLHDGDVTIEGRFMTTFGHGNNNLPGRPIAPLVGAVPTDVSILYRYTGRGSSARISDIVVATASMPVDLDSLPLFWLGKADDRSSVAEAQALLEDAPTQRTREDLIGVIGVHAASDIVVPILSRFATNVNERTRIRVEAAEWLGRHPTNESLAALARLARTDRVGEVRRESAEAVADLRFRPAYDTLAALARELRDREARQEAIEGLGERSEPGVATLLMEIANADPDESVRREAVETLGDLSEGRGVPALRRLLAESPDEHVRQEASETIAEAAEPGVAISTLMQVIREDRSESVRREAVESLGDVRDPQAALTALLEVARRGEPASAREAMETLGDLMEHGRPAEVLEALIGFARSHPVAGARAEAVETLTDHAPPARAAALFTELLDTERSAEVRDELLEGLAGLPDAAGIPALMRLAREHSDPDVRSAALRELGDVDDPKGREAVRRLLRSP